MKINGNNNVKTTADGLRVIERKLALDTASIAVSWEYCFIVDLGSHYTNQFSIHVLLNLRIHLRDLLSSLLWGAQTLYPQDHRLIYRATQVQ